MGIYEPRADGHTVCVDDFLALNRSLFHSFDLPIFHKQRDGTLNERVLNVSCKYGADVLYRNRGDGTFVDVADLLNLSDDQSGRGAAWGGRPVRGVAVRGGCAGVRVSVNGVARELATGATVADVVRSLVETSERGVAVALDGEVVPRGQWHATRLGEGQAVEVLRAVQGG